MKDDLLMEYMKFKHVAAMQQANASEKDAILINQRLAALKNRYEEYSRCGLDLEAVRKLEVQYLQKIRAVNLSLNYDL